MMQEMKGLIWAGVVFVVLGLFAIWLLVDSGTKVSATPAPAAPTTVVAPLLAPALRSATEQQLAVAGFPYTEWDKTTLFVKVREDSPHLESVGDMACAYLRKNGYAGKADVQFVDLAALSNKRLVQYARVRCN